MFKQASTRPLDEVMPLSQEEILPAEQNTPKPPEKKKEFKKVPYRPWDDDEPRQQEGQGKSLPIFKTSIDDSPREGIVENKPREEITSEIKVVELQQPEVERNSPRRIIISLYGVQRNILKFLINNISHEEEPYAYTFPIDLKSIMMFTGSSKNTVETSIRRMKEKTIIESWDHKRGRGGYVTFRIPNILKEEFHNQNNRPIQPEASRFST